jgi:hypothetical protein
LHYFPLSEDSNSETQATCSPIINDDSFSDWCGFHNDHGSLTGLVPAMYIDDNGIEVPSPDHAAGLYVKSRRGALVHVLLPPNSIGFQIGETAQIHTGNLIHIFQPSVYLIAHSFISFYFISFHFTSLYYYISHSFSQ